MTKLPFALSLKLVFRLLLPGLILGLAILPIFQTIAKELALSIETEYAFFLVAILLGWCFVVLDMPIYMAFEGRRYWPDWVRRRLISREERRLRGILAEARRFQDTNRRRYLERSVEVRRFPLNEEGEFYAEHPTRLGNLILAYESYPLRAYGMDAVFYWYRIWVLLEKDQREEIDGQQALADSSLYVSAALSLSGILCGFYLLHELLELGWVGYLEPPTTLAVSSGLLVLSGYIVYRMSLHLHAQFGEVFKAVFDNFHDCLDFRSVAEEVAKLTGDESLPGAPLRDQYPAVWRYLHNFRVKTSEGIVPVPRARQARESGRNATAPGVPAEATTEPGQIRQKEEEKAQSVAPSPLAGPGQ